jgi:DNA-binding Xre family transcriptional regulator
MIRFRIRERLADLSFRRGQREPIESIAEATGIHRATLSKIASQRGYNTTTDNLDKLCRFFGCPRAEIAEYVADEVVLRGDVSQCVVTTPSRHAPKEGRSK